MFKQKMNLDRHSPEPYPNIWHFPDPPIFSLPTTFKKEYIVSRIPLFYCMQEMADEGNARRRRH